jgi:hypothetical protein
MSFYCYEYKSVAIGYDSTESLLVFEKQWLYWFGFGFPFALTQYYFKMLGGSVFFVWFPFLVILSMDKHGVGWQVNARDDRVAPVPMPIFTFCLHLKQTLLNNQ